MMPGILEDNEVWSPQVSSLKNLLRQNKYTSRQNQRIHREVPIPIVEKANKFHEEHCHGSNFGMVTGRMVEKYARNFCDIPNRLVI